MTPTEALAELDGHADRLAFILDSLTVVLPYMKEHISMATRTRTTQPTPEAHAAPRPQPPPAAITTEQIDSALNRLTEDQLRYVMGKAGRVLRERKAVAEGKPLPVTKTPEQRAAEKAAYLEN